MTSQFSPKVSTILAYSREEAIRLASKSVGPEHLLLALLRGSDAIINKIFEQMAVNVESVKTELETRVREYSLDEETSTSELVLNEKASNILKLAVLEARIQHTQTVDVEHLLLAILHDRVDNGAKYVLEFNNMNYEDTLKYLQQSSLPTQNSLGLSEDEDESAMEENTNTSSKDKTTTTQAAKKCRENSSIG